MSNQEQAIVNYWRQRSLCEEDLIESNFLISFYDFFSDIYSRHGVSVMLLGKKSSIIVEDYIDRVGPCDELYYWCDMEQGFMYVHMSNEYAYVFNEWLKKHLQ